MLLMVNQLNAWHPRTVPWSENVPVSGSDAIPRDPVVAMNDAGHVYAAWSDVRPAPDRGIYFAAQPASDIWSAPVKIPGSDARNASSPTIAAGMGQTVYAAWVSGFPDSRADILFAWSTNGGLAWQGPIRVNTDSQDIAGYPDLAVDARGNVHLVWSDLAIFGDEHSRDIKWSMRPAGADIWTEPARVHPDVVVFTEQARPAITADRAGNVYAVWEDARHGPDDSDAIYAARLPAGSVQWEPGRRVDNRPGETNSRPDLAAAPDGTAHAVWDAGVVGGIFSALLHSGAEAWDGPTPVRDAEGPEWSAGDGAPRITVDGRGIAYAVWQDSRSGDADTYAAVRWPGAVQWSGEMRVNDDEGPAIQESPAIAAGGASRVVAVWLDPRDTPSGMVYAAELTLATHTVHLPILVR
jgi:hypothetical protein